MYGFPDDDDDDDYDVWKVEKCCRRNVLIIKAHADIANFVGYNKINFTLLQGQTCS